MKLRKFIAAAFCLAGLAGSPAFAVTVSATASTGLVSGNDQLTGNKSVVATTVAAFDALLSPYFEPGFAVYKILRTGENPTDFSLTETSSTTGSWSYTGQDTAYIAVYKGGPNWIGQYFEGGITENMYDLSDISGTDLPNGGGNGTAGLSHFTLYGVDGTQIAPVPLPAGAALMLTGIGGIAVMRRKKRS